MNGRARPDPRHRRQGSGCRCSKEPSYGEPPAASKRRRRAAARGLRDAAVVQLRQRLQLRGRVYRVLGRELPPDYGRPYFPDASFDAVGARGSEGRPVAVPAELAHQRPPGRRRARAGRGPAARPLPRAGRRAARAARAHPGAVRPHRHQQLRAPSSTSGRCPACATAACCRLRQPRPRHLADRRGGEHRRCSTRTCSILKVHTKKSAWREEHAELAGDGATWRSGLARASCSATGRTSSDILSAFRADPGLGVVTADGSVLGPEFWGDNQRNARELPRRLGVHARRRLAAASRPGRCTGAAASCCRACGR